MNNNFLFVICISNVTRHVLFVSFVIKNHYEYFRFGRADNDTGRPPPPTRLKYYYITLVPATTLSVREFGSRILRTRNIMITPICFNFAKSVKALRLITTVPGPSKFDISRFGRVRPPARTFARLYPAINRPSDKPIANGCAKGHVGIARQRSQNKLIRHCAYGKG